MTAPVDVLAVLDEAADWLYRSSESRGDDDRSEAVKQVRVAVAELIEAISAFRGKRGAFMALGAKDDRVVRLWAALARICGVA